jgi:hypothetical protein
VTSEEFFTAVRTYLGETPTWVKEETSDLVGLHWIVSETAQAKAKRLSMEIGATPPTIYRWATGVSEPHSRMHDVVVAAIDRLNTSEVK